MVVIAAIVCVALVVGLVAAYKRRKGDGHGGPQAAESRKPVIVNCVYSGDTEAAAQSHYTEGFYNQNPECAQGAAAAESLGMYSTPNEIHGASSATVPPMGYSAPGDLTADYKLFGSSAEGKRASSGNYYSEPGDTCASTANRQPDAAYYCQPLNGRDASQPNYEVAGDSSTMSRETYDLAGHEGAHANDYAVPHAGSANTGLPPSNHYSRPSDLSGVGSSTGKPAVYEAPAFHSKRNSAPVGGPSAGAKEARDTSKSRRTGDLVERGGVLYQCAPANGLGAQPMGFPQEQAVYSKAEAPSRIASGSRADIAMRGTEDVKKVDNTFC